MPAADLSALTIFEPDRHTQVQTFTDLQTLLGLEHVRFQTTVLTAALPTQSLSDIGLILNGLLNDTAEKSKSCDLIQGGTRAEVQNISHIEQ
jgi:hypothetical protein